MLKLDKAALVVVDVQGKLATLMHDKDQFFANMVKMITGAQILELPILWNEQLPDKLGETIPEIKELLSDKLSPMIKSSFSCCGNSDFMAKLGNINRRQIILTGMETHICVYQTARDLLMAGYEVYLVTDCVSSRTLENKQVGIKAMQNAGAKATSIETALFELLEIAEGEKFKKIARLVK